MKTNKTIKTSDNQKENFWHVDGYDNPIGKVSRREANYDRTIIHRAIAIMIFDKQDRLLIQRRSITKEMYPGMYCLSLTGHVNYGEEYIDAAIRELYEKSGLRTTKDFLKYEFKIFSPEQTQSEYIAVYSMRIDDFDALNIDKDEVAGVKFLPRKEIETFIKVKGSNISPSSSTILQRYINII